MEGSHVFWWREKGRLVVGGGRRSLGGRGAYGGVVGGVCTATIGLCKGRRGDLQGRQLDWGDERGGA